MAPCLGLGEAALLYKPLDPSFVRYCKELYGHEPLVYAPERIDLSPETPLSLIDAVLEDDQLLARIAEDAEREGWDLDPFIAHPSVHDLGRELNRPVRGMSEEGLRDGSGVQLNNKVHFQHLCLSRNIPVVQTKHAHGWRELVQSVADLARAMHTHPDPTHHRAIMLKQSRANGGLGNIALPFTEIDAYGWPAQDDEQTWGMILRQSIGETADWMEQLILVEPCLNLACSPSIVMRIDGAAIRVLAVTEQDISNNAFKGCIIPGDIPEEWREKMVAHSLEYARTAVALGAQGHICVDWGLVRNRETRKIVKAVAFESNCRYGGSSHPIAIARRLFPETVNGLHVRSCDALHVPMSMSLDQVLTHMHAKHLTWDAVRGDGVVISIPPSDGNMGYVALAQTKSRCRALHEAVQGLFPKARSFEHAA